jgi:4-alpha-glucanotransferase
MLSQRQAGVLCHPSSFPGPYGIGEIGAAARDFIDQIAAAGQRVWQVLPLNPIGNQSAPYSATSSFASNLLLIDFDDLIARGLLKREEVEPLKLLPADHVAYDRVIPVRELLLRLAGRRMAAQKTGHLAEARTAFVSQHGEDWLNDYALWDALSQAHGRAHWLDWPHALKTREPAALAAARVEHEEEIAAILSLQALFDMQWNDLRQHAAKKGVKIVGDMPIFVAQNSAEVWARPDLFKLDEHLRPIVVAGVPPDYFSATGQLWGNPLYRWDRMAEEGFGWWIARVRRLLQLVDSVRIDHFRGFAASWETPAGETTAVNGQWVDAPGQALFAALKQAFPSMPFIAEDLGHITEDVLRLRDDFGLPGLQILQFSFGGEPLQGANHPNTWPVNSVCYPGTHDNNTLLGWLRNDSVDADQRGPDAAREAATALATVGGDETTFAERALALSMEAGSNLVIVMLQDVMGLGSEARMNTPGTVGPANWAWRYRAGAVTDEMWRAFAAATRAGGRWID